MKKNKGQNKIYAALIGISTGLIMTTILIAVCAWLIHTEMVSEKSSGYCIIATLLLSSFVSVWFAVKIATDNNLVVCVGTGVGYYAVLLMITALFYNGRYSGVAQTGLVVLAGSICIFLCGFRGKRKTNSRKKIRYFG